MLTESVLQTSRHRNCCFTIIGFALVYASVRGTCPTPAMADRLAPWRSGAMALKTLSETKKQFRQLRNQATLFILAFLQFSTNEPHLVAETNDMWFLHVCMLYIKIICYTNIYLIVGTHKQQRHGICYLTEDHVCSETENNGFIMLLDA